MTERTKGRHREDKIRENRARESSARKNRVRESSARKSSPGCRRPLPWSF